MRGFSCLFALLGASLIASGAAAQTWLDDGWNTAQPDDSLTTAQLNLQSAYDARVDRGFGPAIEFSDRVPEGNGFAAATRRDVWVEGDAHTDRFRLRTVGQLRRADGSPLPATGLDAVELQTDDYDVSFVRGWPAARGYTASGLEVSLTPHAGVGFGSRGTSAEAGATLRIGSGLERMVPEGQDVFGQRARWYLYAAGSGRAVGYNFARNRDGDYDRSGYSHDSGAFLGDASIGVAYRRGDLQGSVGLVYREIDPEGLRGSRTFDKDVDEGLIAFQLSIKPSR